ncbi:4-hydroxy-tetrahydrodipicolinate reductase [Lewinella sp. W8]|uniref:4-hydroxy-tetrahydrodipicolinate reductase n=1 Tax=Lewinella sp. W8 TaxID=2528208 RepID=UPI0010682F0F|nr:4-hydroxy-tetrahydrodipicolinate reductase [Lewinella sp. W8]MTB50220.1 4-hydroxy-tetrahydrodipicolinate reductase [Lewinella sp. W8]
MRIALLGYGKMGRIIEELAIADGDEIVLKVDESNRDDIGPEDLSAADVAIEFSRPEAAVGNIELALSAGVPIVVGTTGWLHELPAITQRVEQEAGALFWASNFSVGVNVFFATAKRAAELLSSFGGYRASVEEIHHVHKLDAPSGTGITLAETVAAAMADYDSWELSSVDSAAPQKRIAPASAPKTGKQPLPISSVRRDEVPGTHRLSLVSEVDTLEVNHRAHSRRGFAQGALVAARWIRDKRGVFTMNDLLGI